LENNIGKLKLHGYRVNLISKHKLKTLNGTVWSNQPPELSSIYAAASVIPHSVNHPSENRILSISQKFFNRLAFSAGFGVRKQKHYEIFEEKMTTPEYARSVEDFTLLAENGLSWVNHNYIPRRKEIDKVWGWSFNSFFAEVPSYVSSMYKLYKDIGGNIKYQELKSIDDINSLDADIVINCLGRWSLDFFPNDKPNTKIIRGHMIKVGIHQAPTNSLNQYFSYNYVPKKSIYSRKYKNEKGKTIKEASDVYFYPRSDGWLLGGSRQEGFPEIGQKWRQCDEQNFGKTIQKEDWKLPVPEPIWKLNRELILDITGIDVDDSKYPSTSYIGYRFKRDPVRIEKGNEISSKTKLLIHNYGHGGAGYTLSWGSAFEVIKIIEDEKSPKNEIDRDKKLSSGYTSSISRILKNLIIDQYLERNKSKFIPYKE